MLTFLCWVSFLAVSIFLIATFSLTWGHVLLRIFSVHLSVSGHFNNKWESLSFPTFSVPPLLAPSSFQNSSRNHAVSFLYSIVDTQLVNKTLDIEGMIKKFLEFSESTFIIVVKAVGKYEILFFMLFIPHLQILFLEDKFQYKPSISAKVSQVMSYRYLFFTSYVRV